MHWSKFKIHGAYHFWNVTAFPAYPSEQWVSWLLTLSLPSTVYQKWCELQRSHLHKRFAESLQIHSMYMSCVRSSSCLIISSHLNIDDYSLWLWELIAQQCCIGKLWMQIWVIVVLRSGQDITSLQFNAWSLGCCPSAST